MNTENKNSDNQENPLIRVQTTDWNKERLEKLKQLMPDIFTNDGKLNISELKKVVDPQSVNEVERYEFRWFGKSHAKREAFTPTDATFVYDETKSVHPSKSENLIIEGENLAVLKLLSSGYREQIKCIYIDPPYNTGKDFVYSDSWKQDKKEYWQDAEMTENGYKIDSNTETDGRFHSNWLNMMYSRLLIARQLLKEDGVIFISIDDHEVHHLRKICDEVFGEDNFIGIFKWNKTSTPPSLSKKIRHKYEFILCYEKSFNNQEYHSGISSGGDMPLLNEGNSIGIIIIPKDKIKFNFDGFFKAKRYDRIELLEGAFIKGGLSNTNIKIKGPFKWTQQNVNKEILEGTLFIIKTEKFAIRYIKEGIRYKKPSDIISKKECNVGTNEDANKELKKLFGENIMSYPKPTTLISYLTNFTTKNTDLILDFFAGSGTTGQAVTELNQEDGGNRQYILVQLPEQTAENSEAFKAGYKKISDITIERNKRVIEKIIQKKKEATPHLFSQEESKEKQLKGLGFKVFKLQKSNFPRVEYAPDPEKTTKENIESLKKYIRDKEAQLVSVFNRDELITEILIKKGFKLNYTLTKQEQFKGNEILFATDGDKETLICLDVIIAQETVAYFKTHTEQKLIVLERALDTTKKWNLKHTMGDKFDAFCI